MLYKTLDMLKGAALWIWKNMAYVVALLLMGVSFYLGWFLCQHYDQNVIEVPVIEKVEVEKPIEIPVEVKGDTVIKYVEKEVPAAPDVQVVASAPTITVDYNGQKTELAGITGETQKFEKGQLKVEQTTNATLDVTPIVKREVDTAVTKQKAVDELDKNKAIDTEKHKAHKHGQKTFLYGLGVGLLAVAF